MLTEIRQNYYSILNLKNFTLTECGRYKMNSRVESPALVSPPLLKSNNLIDFIQKKLFFKVSDCTVSKELSAYQVEYEVLQEELSICPQQDADMQKLKESSKNLKRQNLDLLEQLHVANNRQQTLETMNQVRRSLFFYIKIG